MYCDCLLSPEGVNILVELRFDLGAGTAIVVTAEINLVLGRGKRLFGKGLPLGPIGGR